MIKSSASLKITVFLIQASFLAPPSQKFKRSHSKTLDSSLIQF